MLFSRDFGVFFAVTYPAVCGGRSCGGRRSPTPCDGDTALACLRGASASSLALRADLGPANRTGSGSSPPPLRSRGWTRGTLALTFSPSRSRSPGGLPDLRLRRRTKWRRCDMCAMCPPGSSPDQRRPTRQSAPPRRPRDPGGALKIRIDSPIGPPRRARSRTQSSAPSPDGASSRRCATESAAGSRRRSWPSRW